jgi:hypothetical protein
LEASEDTTSFANGTAVSDFLFDATAGHAEHQQRKWMLPISKNQSNSAEDYLGARTVDGEEWKQVHDPFEPLPRHAGKDMRTADSWHKRSHVRSQIGTSAARLGVTKIFAFGATEAVLSCCSI